MDFKEFLGESYHENMTFDEVETAMQGKKLADLSSGDYVSKKKYDDAINSSNDYKQKYETLKNNSNVNTDEFETIKTENENLKKSNADLTEKVNNYQYAEVIRKANIDEKFNDYLTYEAKKGMDDKTDFKTSLDNILKDNPQYKKQESTRKVNSSFSLTGNSPKESSNSAINNAILSAVGRNK